MAPPELFREPIDHGSAPNNLELTVRKLEGRPNNQWHAKLEQVNTESAETRSPCLFAYNGHCVNTQEPMTGFRLKFWSCARFHSFCCIRDRKKPFDAERKRIFQRRFSGILLYFSQFSANQSAKGLRAIPALPAEPPVKAFSRAISNQERNDAASSNSNVAPARVEAVKRAR